MADDKTPRSNARPEDGQASDSEPSNQGAEGSHSSPEALQQRLEELEQETEKYRDQALRAQAEAENTRRRASRDVEHAHKFALEKFAVELLPVLDSLEKAVEVAAESDAAVAIGEGVELSLKLFLSVLEKQGIERIDPVGEPFDPRVHEALTMVASHHAEPNSVLEVMQRGYLLNGRVIRAAKVVVAKAPEQSSADSPGDSRAGQ